MRLVASEWNECMLKNIVYKNFYTRKMCREEKKERMKKIS